MNARTKQVANYLLYAFAFVWPLDVFQYVPGLNVNGTDLIALVLVGLMVYDSLKGERLRVPFEILWPVTLLLVLIVIVFLRGTANVPLHAPVAIGLFAATIHFARSRAAIENWLRAAVFSGAVVSSLTLLTPMARSAGIVPTAYSLESGAALTFAHDLDAGIQMLILWVVIGAFLLSGGPQRKVTRRVTALAVLVIGGCLVLVTVPEFSAGVVLALPEYLTFPGTVQAVLLLVLWLTARVAAKVEVSRRESPPGRHALFLAVIAAMALWTALFPSSPGLFQAYLLGLACAYVAPEKRGVSLVPLPKIALAVAAVLVVLNLRSVYPGHQDDPRNYETAARADFENGRFETLRARMDYFVSLHYAEPRAHLWLARTALAQGLHEEASFAFRLSMAGENDGQLLAGPSENERKDFLVRLRDHCSALPHPESTVAYERACLAAGDVSATLGSLKLRVRAPGIEATNLDPAPLAAALAFILGDPSPAWAFDNTQGRDIAANAQVASSLMGWPASDLLTVLAQLGVEISRAPAGFPSTHLPLVLVAEQGGRVPVILGRTRSAGLETLANTTVQRGESPDVEVVEGAGGAAWSALALDDAGRWVARLDSTGNGDSVVLARVYVDSEGILYADWLRAEPQALPHAPVTRIWLP